VVGGGALRADAGSAVVALAERLGAPVMVTDDGRSVVSDRHPLVVTSLGGRQLIGEADVVLGVGTRFVNLRGLRLAARGQVVLLNADPSDLGGVRAPTVAIEGDAALGLEALLAELDGERTRPPTWADLEAVRADAARQIAAIEPQAGYVRALREAIPEDGVLVNELTQVGYLARIAYPVYRPHTLLGPGYQGTLGYGFPTALGVQVARPDAAVVAITGDGGFGWSLQELATAQRYGLPLVTVVFNDGAFGNVRRTQQAEFGGRLIGTDLANPDFVQLSRAFGIHGERVDSPAGMAGAISAALRARAPALVEVQVGDMPSPWPLLTGVSAADRR
jgi:acetolactate synthase-1/2/3 large subunit